MNPFYTTYQYIPFDKIKEEDYEPAMLKGIEEINGYLAIDRSKRISYFTKQHWDAAGIDNSIVIDEAIVRFHEIEKDYKVYPGYKSVSKLS